jgi:hypothetical protein
VGKPKSLSAILHNLCLLLDPLFKAVQPLNHYRKEPGRQIAASREPDAMLQTV